MMTAKLATLDEIDEVLSMIRDLSWWLKTKGIHQWSDSFPREVLEKEVSHDELYVLHDGGKVIASVALSTEEGELWDQEDENAVYLHRLTVLRSRAGEKLGEAMMTWAENETRSRGAKKLRLVCDTSNPFLPSYYRRLGYESKGTKLYEPWKMTFERLEKQLI
jgi:predicted N-acetyltransferase YhbS